MVDRSGAHRAVTHAIRARDTAGAGDVVCGVFAGLLAQGEDVCRALDVAVAAASLSVARPGTSGACPTREEIGTLLIGAGPEGRRR